MLAYLFDGFEDLIHETDIDLPIEFEVLVEIERKYVRLFRDARPDLPRYHELPVISQEFRRYAISDLMQLRFDEALLSCSFYQGIKELLH